MTMHYQYNVLFITLAFACQTLIRLIVHAVSSIRFFFHYRFRHRSHRVYSLVVITVIASLDGQDPNVQSTSMSARAIPVAIMASASIIPTATTVNVFLATRVKRS